MKISFYLPSKDGIPVPWIFDRGWNVSCGPTFLGIYFIKYSNY